MNEVNMIEAQEQSSTRLVRYDAMCTAIAECHKVDEVKDLRDKARALELYAKQARNTDAERKASEVRLRAERRTGELLRDLERATVTNPAGIGGKTHKVVVSNDATQQPASPYAETLDRLGMSRQSAGRYQALANVDKETFERALADPDVPPTTSRIIAANRTSAEPIEDGALWLWGRAREFERDNIAKKKPVALMGQMTGAMQADVARVAPSMAEFFVELDEAIHEQTHPSE